MRKEKKILNKQIKGAKNFFKPEQYEYIWDIHWNISY